MSLNNLPRELILQVFLQINEPKAIKSVACVCRTFKDIAEICLYSQVRLYQRASIERVLSLCQNDARRASYVHELHLLYSTKQHDFTNAQTVDLSYFPCLKVFVSESPFCNAHSRVGRQDDATWKEDMKTYLRVLEKASLRSEIPSAEKPLSQLRSLTLHWTASLNLRFWETTPACPVFLLPELRILELSCVKIKVVESDPDLSSFRKMTKLESLTFSESVVSPDALEQILSLPLALTSFVLHEINYHRTDTSLYKSFRDDVDTSYRALSQQATSLRRFDFFGLHSGYIPRASRDGRYLDLSNMKALTYLRLDSSDCGIASPPPHLETLCLTNVDLGVVRLAVQTMLLKATKLEECIRNCSARNKDFQLDLHVRSHYRMRLMSSGNAFSVLKTIETVQSELDGLKRLAMRSLETELGTLSYTIPEQPEEDMPAGTSSNYGNYGQTSLNPPSAFTPVRLRVLTSKKIRYVPPFLHGEEKPRMVVRYDFGFLEDPCYEDTGLVEIDDENGDEEMRAAFLGGELL